MRRWLLLAAVVVLAAPVVVFVLVRRGSGDQQTEYLQAAVSRQTVAQQIEATGNVQPERVLSLAFSAAAGSGSGGSSAGGSSGSGSRTTSVSAGEPAVRTVSVRVGQQVKAGQVLAQLDDSQQQQQLTVAKAQLAAAQAKADEPASRTTSGPAGSSAAQATTDAQNAAAVAQAQQQVDDAQAALDATKLVAPADGVVTAVNIGAGLPAPAGQAAVEERSTAMMVQASVSEMDVPGLKAGLQAQVTFPALQTSTTATVASSPTQADSSSGGTGAASTVVTFPVQLTIPHPPAGLLPGMSAQIAITVVAHRNVLTVPTSAIGGSADSPTVQVLVDGKPRERDVLIGLSTDSLTEVVTGLREGEIVVTGVVNPQRSTSTRLDGGTGGRNGGFGGFGGVPGGFGGPGRFNRGGGGGGN